MKLNVKLEDYIDESAIKRFAYHYAFSIVNELFTENKEWQEMVKTKLGEVIQEALLANILKGEFK